MNIISQISPAAKLFEKTSDSLFVSLLVLILTCTYLFSVRKRSLRKTLLISDVASDKDHHHLNIIKRFAEKYSNVRYMSLTGGKLELNLNQAKDQYNRVILLSALRARPEDSQLLLYKDLHSTWKENLIVFYVKSPKESNFSLADFEATQVNLEAQDYTSQTIKEKLRTFLKIDLWEEFQGTLYICVTLIFLFFVILRFALIGVVSPDNTRTEPGSIPNVTNSSFYKNLDENGAKIRDDLNNIMKICVQMNDTPNTLVNRELTREEFYNQSLKNLTRRLGECENNLVAMMYRIQGLQGKNENTEEKLVELMQEIKDIKNYIKEYESQGLVEKILTHFKLSRDYAPVIEGVVGTFTLAFFIKMLLLNTAKNTDPEPLQDIPQKRNYRPYYAYLREVRLAKALKRASRKCWPEKDTSVNECQETETISNKNQVKDSHDRKFVIEL